MAVDEADHITLLAVQVTKDHHPLLLNVWTLCRLAGRGEGAAIFWLLDWHVSRHVSLSLVELRKDAVDLLLNFLFVISFERYKVAIV